VFFSPNNPDNIDGRNACGAWDFNITDRESVAPIFMFANFSLDVIGFCFSNATNVHRTNETLLL